MARQSITLTEPNDEWLKAQIESKEFSSKSEVINDLVRQARRQSAENEWLREKLNRAEESGFTYRTIDEIKAEAKKRLNE